MRTCEGCGSRYCAYYDDLHAWLCADCYVDR